MRIIFGSEKKKIMEKLAYYGIEKVPHLLLKFGKDKIRGYTGHLSTDEIQKIDRIVNIDLIGLYLFNEHDDEIRLSLDAVHFFKNQITKNIIELTSEQAEKWLRGEDLEIAEKWKTEEHGFKVIKFERDFLGMAKLTKERLINYMPKERRVRSK